jgi:hypothetical protein
MADNREGRPADAGDRNGDDRRRAQTILRRIERWEIPDDGFGSGRPHRASRVRLNTRTLRTQTRRGRT